jgi:hypothetical protein
MKITLKNKKTFPCQPYLEKSPKPFPGEFGRICGVSRRKPGYPLQSFGCAKSISASIPCAENGTQPQIPRI